MPPPSRPDPPIMTYGPGSLLRDPSRLFRDMRRDLAASRELAWRLLVRNTSAKYRQTLLGYAWAFLPPVFTTLVFVFLRDAGFFNAPETEVPYVVFLLAGMVLWEVFADALNSPIRMVGQSTSMLTKVNFPREALILAGIGEVLVSFLIRLSLLAIVIAWFGVSVPWTAVLFPFGALALVVLGVALGALLTPFAILYHDIGQGLPFLVTIWMFLTPVVYSPPREWPGSLTMVLNPVSPVLDTTRALLLTGSPESFAGFLAVSLVGGVALLLGWLLYRVALPILIERLSA
ncbi:MAG TPA: ABC transporter permease [Candidatus Binatia bacterium]|nr:ABC transporter permease [Candidatus Binatia bacterium]